LRCRLKRPAIQPSAITVQPPISTIPCKILYFLANPVLPFPMFTSPSAFPTNRTPRLHPDHCHPACHVCPVYPEERRERSEGSAFRLSPLHALNVSASPLSSFRRSSPAHPLVAFSRLSSQPFNSKPSTLNRFRVSPFPATLTGNSQLTENPATLSPVPATLTPHVTHNSFVCHSCRKHPGGGYTLAEKRREVPPLRSG
jgi:hypothetical protein